MSDKLLPCPFCGGDPHVLGEGDRPGAKITCRSEECIGPASTDYHMSDAIIQWNTRSNPSHAQLAAARSALVKIADPDFWAVDPYGSDEEVNGRRAERGDAAYELAVSTVSTLTQEPAGQVSGDADLRLSDVLSRLHAKHAELGKQIDLHRAENPNDSVGIATFTARRKGIGSAIAMLQEAGARRTAAVSGDAAGWQPIETAPESETVLVAGGDASYPVTASWSGLYDECWMIDGQEDVHAEIGWPTHWMRLPDPPAPAATPAQSERQLGGAD